MIDLGQHAVFIVWSYIGVAVATLGLIGVVVVSARRADARLRELEAQDPRRRAQGETA